MRFEVDRNDFSHTRFVPGSPPDQLADGQVHLELESFAFTANNITYAVAGDMLDYWGFFPATAPWGRIPVMGIGRVVRSAHADLPDGGRYFGFYPMADHHVVTVAPNATGFVDRAEHRAPHAAAYRAFDLVDADPAYAPDLEGEYLVTRGLFATSFLIDDLLADNGSFGADTVIITSASSRTSIALAHRLRARGNERVVALTSARNREFVASVGLYDSIVTYDEIESLDADAPSVLVDMAGSAEIVGRVHRHLGDRLRFSSAVGVTHRDAGGSSDGLPGPPPTFFFAPTRMKQRSDEWGRTEFAARLADAFAAFLDHAHGWMAIERASGPDAVEAVYRSTLAGANDPTVGHILSLADR